MYIALLHSVSTHGNLTIIQHVYIYMYMTLYMFNTRLYIYIYIHTHSTSDRVECYQYTLYSINIYLQIYQCCEAVNGEWNQLNVQHSLDYIIHITKCVVRDIT